MSFWSNRVPVSMVNRSVCGRGTHTHILASCPLVIRIKGWSRCFCVCFMDIEYRGESTCTHTHTDRRVCAPMLNVTPVIGNVDEKAQLSLLTNTQTTSSPFFYLSIPPPPFPSLSFSPSHPSSLPNFTILPRRLFMMCVGN